MAVIGVPSFQGERLAHNGVAGTGDNAIVIETEDISRYNQFSLASTAGAMDVEASLDGITFYSAPLSMADLGSITTAPVILTAAGRMYGFRGIYRKIRVRQNGGSNVANARLLMGRVPD